MEFDNEALDSLSDEEFCRITGMAYLYALAGQNDADYEINRPQWLKMVEVLDYFGELAEKCNGVVDPCEIRPSEAHGGVTAYFTVLDIQENDIPQFCKILLMTTAITVDATSDGRICISVSVPNVFVRKN